MFCFFTHWMFYFRHKRRRDGDPTHSVLFLVRPTLLPTVTAWMLQLPTVEKKTADGVAFCLIVVVFLKEHFTNIQSLLHLFTRIKWPQIPSTGSGRASGFTTTRRSGRRSEGRAQCAAFTSWTRGLQAPPTSESTGGGKRIFVCLLLLFVGNFSFCLQVVSRSEPLSVLWCHIWHVWHHSVVYVWSSWHVGH